MHGVGIFYFYLLISVFIVKFAYETDITKQ